MTKHMTGTSEEWLAVRLELLKAGKELTRRSDELARRRQELPWVRVDKAYRFQTDEGSASLAEGEFSRRTGSERAFFAVSVLLFAVGVAACGS
jgi:predicted dithiol-disulfide oxidoreductase (DUF899 family)